MDGKRRRNRGWMANGDSWAGISFLDRAYGGSGFLCGEPENWIFVGQCMGRGRVVWSGRVWVHVLGGGATLECDAKAVFVGSANYGDYYAYCVRGIADCADGEEVFEIRKAKIATESQRAQRNASQEKQKHQ